MMISAFLLVASTFVLFSGIVYALMSAIFLTFNPLEWNAIGRGVFIFIAWIVACEQIKTFNHIKAEWDKLTKDIE